MSNTRIHKIEQGRTVCRLPVLSSEQGTLDWGHVNCQFCLEARRVTDSGSVTEPEEAHIPHDSTIAWPGAVDTEGLGPRTSASDDADVLMAKRIEALKAAREVLVSRSASKGPFTSGGTEAPKVPDLLAVAEYIMNGLVVAADVADSFDE